MDRYTQKTRKWLNNRFRKCDRKGIYLPHNPIYGFGRSRDGLIGLENYSRAYQIIKALSSLSFKSLLDVGGAEGYYSFLVREIFGVTVRNSDLSTEACKRAREIFEIESDSCDAHKLPYRDGQFDVVICSETLEHLTRPYTAMAEILRVASYAAVIAVPYEPQKAILYNITHKVPHGHIKSFNEHSFDYLKKDSLKIYVKKIDSVLLSIPDALLRAKRIGYYLGRYPRIIFGAYNLCLFIFKKPLVKRFLLKFFNKKICSSMLLVDEFICKLLPFNHDLLFVILKEKDGLSLVTRNISPEEILSRCVPYCYIVRRTRKKG